jgi:integron integrase
MKNLTPPLPPLKSVRLLDQLRERIRYVHYSIRTEQTYVHWVKAFIRFHGLRHPAEMGRAEIEAFLSWLANERSVAVSTHKQALSALLFMYWRVLGIDLPWMSDIGRPRATRRLPVVLSPDEVQRVFTLMDGEHRLFAQLLYGTGMRLTEGLRLRVKDLDFERRTVIVREGKGRKDRALMLPQVLVIPLREQLARARVLWDDDRRCGRAGVEMPDALARKYPRAEASWAWFWVFPQAGHAVDPRSGVVRRHHMYDQTFQRAFKRAVVRAGEPGAGALSSRAGLWERSIDREWRVEQMPAATWRIGFAINGSLPQLHRFHSGSKPAAGCAARWTRCPRWRRHPRGPDSGRSRAAVTRACAAPLRARPGSPSPGRTGNPRRRWRPSAGSATTASHRLRTGR